MAQFYDCWQRRRTTIEELEIVLEDAYRNQVSENGAAITIQRLFRGQFLRQTLCQWNNAAIVLARVYRGHLARKRCRQLRQQLCHEEKCAVLHYHAILIQKILRGVYSRRTKLDFRLRKAYVREIAQKGQEMRQKLAQHFKQQQLDEQQAIEQAARSELATISQDLHHLVSTRTIPGVYNSPMLSTTATAFGIPIETHIRENTKALVHTQRVTAKPPTKLVPYPPSDKTTIQASTPYDTPLQAVRTYKKYHKLRRSGTKDFQTVSNQDTRYLPGLNTGVEYMDPCENPYLKRGIPRNENDLLPRISTLGKPPKEKEKPFYTRSGGNKSKVYANDRFDV